MNDNQLCRQSRITAEEPIVSFSNREQEEKSLILGSSAPAAFPADNVAALRWPCLEGLTLGAENQRRRAGGIGGSDANIILSGAASGSCGSGGRSGARISMRIFLPFCR